MPPPRSSLVWPLLVASGATASLTPRSRAGVLALRGGADQLSTDDDRALYALGCNVGRQVGDLDCFAPEEIDIILVGLKDVLTHADLKVNMADAMPKAGELFKARQAAYIAKVVEDGQAALAAAAAEAGAIKTDSGLVIRMLREGDGASPSASDTVKVHYEGTLTNGHVFDSTHQRGAPVEFPLGAVVTGWQEGIQMMKVGGKAVLTLPPELGYGDEGKAVIPPKATLTFEVELLAVVDEADSAAEGSAESSLEEEDEVLA